MGLTGVAYWGSDIGGFHAIANGRTTDELNIRWLQFGAVSGVMRTQANGLSLIGARSDRSQVWSPDVLPIWRRYAKLRTQLQPYLLAASEEYQRTALPLMRQLALEFPGDERAARSQTEFMFGPDILAAPVIEPDRRTRRLYLPRGRWIDLWRSARYRKGSGSIALRRADVLRGGREVRLPAPLDELPLLVRPGAILPMLDPDVDTLTDVGHGRGLVAAADRPRRLRLVAFPAGRSDARLAGGDRVASALSGEGWRLRLDTDTRRSYRVEAALAAGAPAGAPCSVRFDGRRLAAGRWTYDRGTRVLDRPVPRRRGRSRRKLGLRLTGPRAQPAGPHGIMRAVDGMSLRGSRPVRRALICHGRRRGDSGRPRLPGAGRRARAGRAAAAGLGGLPGAVRGAAPTPLHVRAAEGSARRPVQDEPEAVPAGTDQPAGELGPATPTTPSPGARPSTR